MPDLFGVDIQGILKDAIGDGFPSITVVKVTPGTRDPANPAAGVQPTRSPFGARGILDDYSDRQIDGTLVKTGDRKVLIVAGTLPSTVVPEPNDEIITEGKTWKIVRTKRDPAEATYECQVREAS